MRIIAGKHRGRRIAMKDDAGIRPTSSRTREAIFNILMHNNFGLEGDNIIVGKRIVDIFCGTGALGLEALSRGAEHVTFIDRNPQSLALVRETAAHFKEEQNAAFVRSDSTALPKATRSFSVAFADPPYDQGQAAPALNSLRQNGWLEQNAIIVVEISAKELIQLPEGFEQLDERKYGNSKVLILRNM